MLTWGYGKLDHTPAGDLLDQVAQRLEAEISLYHHQAVANMFYSLGRLGQYSPSVCSTVEMHVTEHADDFSTQVCNLDSWQFICAQLLRNCLGIAISEHEVEFDAGVDEHPVGVCEVSLCTNRLHRNVAQECPR